MHYFILKKSISAIHPWDRCDVREGDGGGSRRLFSLSPSLPSSSSVKFWGAGETISLNTFLGSDSASPPPNDSIAVAALSNSKLADLLDLPTAANILLFCAVCRSL